ncbi:MAG: hypothetical protein P8P56_02030 [Yoonia sp.]|nr:hypothetical protein [Yoonia sp.]
MAKRYTDEFQRDAVRMATTRGLPGEFNLPRIERSDFRLLVLVIYTS